MSSASWGTPGLVARGRVMPITAFQREVLRLIAANRNPDSFIAGGTVINRRPDSPRTSRDIDLFHDAQESLRLSFQRDAEVLSAAGLSLTVLIDQPSFVRAVVADGSDQVRPRPVQTGTDINFSFGNR